MQDAEQKRRLSGVDAAFLYLERREIPLNIAGISIFEEAIPFEEFVAHVGSRLHMVPRYRQIVSEPPFHAAYPTWEPDPNFDIRNHIFHVHLDPPGSHAQLEALAGRIISRLMDRNKPLWDIHLVDGLKNGRSAMILRWHHAMADGISGVDLLDVTFDRTPEHSRPRARRRPQPATAPPPPPSMLDTLGSAVRNTLDSLISVEHDVLGVTQDFLTGQTLGGIRKLVGIMPELAQPVERLPFNRPCGAGRKFCMGEFPLADVKAVRTALGGTVNDVFLTVVARGVAEYVKLHGESVVHRYLRVVCPVNLRDATQRGTLGNRLSFLPVVLPMGLEDPAKTLQAVAERMEIMKNLRTADLVNILGDWIRLAPSSLQALFWRGLPLITFPVPLFNMICTNIPGPPVPLYALGRRMLTLYPHVPTGQELGVNCAVISYDGKMFFGLTADAHAAPDVAKLRDFFNSEFQRLCRAAGIKKPRRVQGRTGAAKKPAAPPTGVTAETTPASSRAVAAAAGR